MSGSFDHDVLSIYLFMKDTVNKSLIIMIDASILK